MADRHKDKPLSLVRFGPDDPRPVESHDIMIDREGQWYHKGQPIARMALVRLFATVLRRDEAGEFWLVTPAERGRVTVEDAPFLAVSCRREGESLIFTTNLGDDVAAGPDHPLRVAVDDATGQPRPYLTLRPGIEARISRPVFYQLVEDATERRTQDGVELGVRSGGQWFSLGRI